MIYSFPVQKDTDIFIPNQFDKLSLVWPHYDGFQWTHGCVSLFKNRSIFGEQTRKLLLR